jgi:hypothetical protein
MRQKLNYKRIGESTSMVSLKCDKCGNTLIEYQKEINKAWTYHQKVCERRHEENAILIKGGRK